jgi:hypothetical protein
LVTTSASEPSRPTPTVVTVVALKPLRSRDRREVEAAFERYAHFVDTPVQAR